MTKKCHEISFFFVCGFLSRSLALNENGRARVWIPVVSAKTPVFSEFSLKRPFPKRNKNPNYLPCTKNGTESFAIFCSSVTMKDMIDGNRANIILVYRVLAKYSDREHFLTQTEICNYIHRLYGVDIERKTIGRIISVLCDLDYDIQKGDSHGFALVSRKFDESEIKFLVDAIFSSKAIPGRIAQDLATRLSDDLSQYERKNYTYLLKSGEINRTENKEVFYNIEIITEAIKRGKWISYYYMTYDSDGNLVPRFDGYIYHASPCYLVNNSGNYYLLAFRRGVNKVISWRIDYMRNIGIMEDRERIDPTTLPEFASYKDISEYMNDHIYLFGGEVVDATFSLNGAYAISYIKDWFGSTALIYRENDELYAKVRCDENALFYWAMQYGDHVTVIEPASLVKKIYESAKKLAEKHESLAGIVGGEDG
ncbi:MAG: WYL domain-containing protein [Bacilli bacterium]|nr:WYL domain-containing protein [Bacilli bacterium]